MLPRLRACRAVRFAVPDRPAGTLSVTDFADPLVASEWWRTAIGVTGLTPPGPGKPVTIIDSGVNVTHPEFTGRSDLVMLNAQEPQPLGGVHGTAVASLIGAAENGVGIVGVYPQAVLQSWDSAIGSGTRLATSEIVQGVLAAAARGPGVINLSLGSDGNEVPIAAGDRDGGEQGDARRRGCGQRRRRRESAHLSRQPAARAHGRGDGLPERRGVLLEPLPLRRPGRAGAGHLRRGRTRARAGNRRTGRASRRPSSPELQRGSGRRGPTLDASQLFEVMRRSATDIGAPGRDDASGFGLLSVPAALAYAAPIKDSPEPNDDIEYVKPGGTYYNGIPALTSRAKPSAAVTGRITVFEDPRDLYPVFVPKNGRITVKTSAASTTDLALWSRTAATVTASSAGKGRLARGRTQGSTETLTYVNAGAATTAYLAVSLATRTRDATYRVTVAAR